MNEYFSIKEFDCPCCGKNYMKVDFLDQLTNARIIADTPFPINSGYRCPKHNKEVGSTSQNHPQGRAADIKCANNQKRLKILTGLIKAGFTRIEIHRTFIHVDNMPKTPFLGVKP